MAIDTKEFIIQIESNLKSNKATDKFFINFVKDGKRIRKVLDYSKKTWDKRTRISKAKLELIELREKENTSGINFSENSTLNQVKDVYFENVRQDTEWTEELKSMYRLYIENSIGKKKIKDIRKVHIDSLRKSMEEKGHSKQTKNGCSPRTIKKVLIQTLKPILVYVVENKILDSIPTIELPKAKLKKKKTVTSAQEKLATLFQTINEIYVETPFYRALFLFALYGRRWNEIRTLEWNDIDLLNNTYTIRAENNKIGEDQTFDLPLPIVSALSEIKDDNIGLVFKSPVTGKELYPPKKQLAKIKEKANIPELTMHYFRHILVSAMGEMGTANTILSASLGHTNLQTVNDYYLSANHTKASVEANKTLDSIVNKKL